MDIAVRLSYLLSQFNTAAVDVVVGAHMIRTRAAAAVSSSGTPLGVERLIDV